MNEIIKTPVLRSNGQKLLNWVWVVGVGGAVGLVGVVGMVGVVEVGGW